ncbi:MAG: OmpA family protein [Paludibacteraceae bacterium]|nr:OmpA family protein [Paludibacteraceae bacterium]
MKWYSSLSLVGLLLLSMHVFAQKDMQPTPELRKFSQQGWKIQHAHMSFDSLTIYFSAVEPGKSGYDLYVTHSRAGFWSAPERMNDSVNTANADELWPSVSSDERRLYFVRRTYAPKLIKSSRGAQGIYDHLFTSDNLRGEWQQAEPAMVSTNQDISPLVLPDNKTILFARKEVEKKRQYYALFYTRYLGYGTWTLPVRVDSLERRSLYGPYLKNLKDTVLQVTEMQEQERDKKELDTIYLNRQIVLPAGMRSGRYGVLTGVVTDENSGRAVEANIRLYDAITANALDEALSDATTGRFRVALQPYRKYNIDITAPNYSHYYMTLDCMNPDSLTNIHVQVQIARNLSIRINPYDAELYTPEPQEREVIRNVATDKTLRVRTKREEQGRVYELPIGETYALTLYRRGYQDTTILINTLRDVRFSAAEFDVPVRPIKKPLTLQLGNELNGTVKEGTIRLRNRNKHEVIEMPYNPPTTTIMLRQEDEYELVIQSPGHFFFDTIVSIPEGYDQQLCEVSLTPIQKDMIVQLRNIQFESNSYILTRSSHAELDKVVKLMEANPGLKIELSAHTDDVGTDEYNDQLSSKRGESAMEYIIRKGIDRSRLTSTGYGERRPLVPNTSDANRAINRRVEFKVTEF